MVSLQRHIPFSDKTIVVALFLAAALLFYSNGFSEGGEGITGKYGSKFPGGQRDPDASRGAGTVTPAGFGSGINWGVSFKTGEDDADGCKIVYVNVGGRERAISNCPKKTGCLPQGSGKTVAQLTEELIKEGRQGEADKLRKQVTKEYGNAKKDVPKNNAAKLELEALVICDCFDKEKDDPLAKLSPKDPEGMAGISDGRSMPPGGKGYQGRGADPRAMAGGGTPALGSETDEADRAAKAEIEKLIEKAAEKDPEVQKAQAAREAYQNEVDNAKKGYDDAKKNHNQVLRDTAGQGGDSAAQARAQAKAALNAAKAEYDNHWGRDANGQPIQKGSSRSEGIRLSGEVNDAQRAATERIRARLVTNKREHERNCRPDDDACLDEAQMAALRKTFEELGMDDIVDALFNRGSPLYGKRKPLGWLVDIGPDQEGDLEGPLQGIGNNKWQISPCGGVMASPETGRPPMEGDAIICDCPNGKPIINICPGKGGSDSKGAGSPLFCGTGTDPEWFTDPPEQGEEGGLPGGPGVPGGGWTD